MFCTLFLLKNRHASISGTCNESKDNSFSPTKQSLQVITFTSWLKVPVLLTSRAQPRQQRHK